MEKLLLKVTLVGLLAQLYLCSAQNGTTSCPFGTRSSGDKCVCNPAQVESLLFMCYNETLSLPLCYCMSYNDRFNATVVGYCVMRCHFNYGDPQQLPSNFRYKLITHTNNLSDINKDWCSGLHMNRTGQLCGSCLKGYAPPVYSYSMDCVNCTSNYKYNWLKYIAIAYLPLTAFYIFVIVFRLSITSGTMNGYVLTAQLFGAPAVVRFLSVRLSGSSHEQITLRRIFNVEASFYGIFNLDFFRPFYPSFCLHPDMTTIQTLALEYGIAVYPLLLIIVTYIAVSLHYQYSTVVRLWRPVYKCFIKLRKEWYIRASLVEAFATFILLSYVKILNTSLDLLTPVLLYDVRFPKNIFKQLYLQASGNIEYFGHDHLPYALLALFMMITFNILPIVLLFLYPCQCFHRCLNYFNIRRQILNEFMEVFYSSFKQTHPRDFRQFAAVYLLIRFINFALLSVMNGYWYFVASGIVFFISALVIGVARPHRSIRHTIVDTIMITCIATASIAIPSQKYVQYFTPDHYKRVFNYVIVIVVLIHFIYGVGMVVFTILPYGKLKGLFLAIYAKVCTRQSESDNEGETLHNYGDLSEYTPLI